MKLTGYDSPPLHTLYLHRLLKGGLLMQTLARVNRTFRGKQDSLLVAYAPLADNLQKAPAEYTVPDQEHRPVGCNIDEAAWMPQPSLAYLGPNFVWRPQEASNPHLAIEALLKALTDEAARATRSNVIRQRAFTDRIIELMTKYTNQQLKPRPKSFAELVKLAREVALAGQRGARFTPALREDELAFYDAVALNESAVQQRVRVCSPHRTGAGGNDAPRRADRLDGAR